MNDTDKRTDEPTRKTAAETQQIVCRDTLASFLLLLFLIIFHGSFAIYAINGIATNAFSAGLQMIIVGFWIGVGRVPLWLRLGLFAALALYLPWILDPTGTRYGGNIIWTLGDDLEPLTCIVLGSAIFSNLVPRLCAWSVLPIRLPRFDLINLMLITAAVGLCAACWQEAVRSMLRNDWHLHVYAALGVFPLGLVVACVGCPLLFHEQELRKKARRYAIVLFFAAPIFYFALGSLLHSQLIEFATLSFQVILAAAFMIYPMHFVCWSYQVPWLQTLDEPG